MVHVLGKQYLKYDGHDVEPFYIFFLGSGGTGKYHLVEVLHNPKSKTLLYHCKHPEKPRVLLLGPTKISAVYIVFILSLEFNLEQMAKLKLL